MKTVYHTPGGPVYTLYQEMLRQPHLLIAGATGSGKSVLLNGLIHTALHDSPARVQFILLDPKRVELDVYKRLPHTIQYAMDTEEMVAALENALRISDDRFRTMKRRGERTWTGSQVYVIIDELAALMTVKAIRPRVTAIIQRLGFIARASGVHMVACTQTVKATVLDTTITCNFDARVALRTSTAQQSRMIIDRAGCELFPSPVLSHQALCYYRTGADLGLWKVPRVPEEETAQLVKYWTSPACRTRSLF